VRAYWMAFAAPRLAASRRSSRTASPPHRSASPNSPRCFRSAPTEGADSDSNVPVRSAARPQLAGVGARPPATRPLRLADLRLQLLRGRLPLLQLLRPAQGHGALSPVARRAGPRDRLRAGARRRVVELVYATDPSTTRALWCAMSAAPYAPSRTSKAAASSSAPSTSPARPTKPSPTPVFVELCSGTRRWTSSLRPLALRQPAQGGLPHPHGQPRPRARRRP